jgi:hypothetical protein
MFGDTSSLFITTYLFFPLFKVVQSEKEVCSGLVAGIRSPRKSKDTSLRYFLQMNPRDIHSSYPLGTVGSFFGFKAAGARRNHSLLSSTQIKNAYNFKSIRPYIFIAWYLTMFTNCKSKFIMSPSQ